MAAAGPPGELRDHRAVGEDSLYIVGVWESDEAMRTRFASQQMRDALARAGLPPMDEAEIRLLRVHAVEPLL